MLTSSEKMLSRSWVRVIVLLTCGPSVRVHAVLPPGYEDELYCPEGFCLASKDMGRGFCGPASAFWECFHKDTHERKKPTPWGPKAGGEDAKQALLAQNHHTERCSPEVDALSKELAQKAKEARQAEREAAAASGEPILMEAQPMRVYEAVPVRVMEAQPVRVIEAKRIERVERVEEPEAIQRVIQPIGPGGEMPIQTAEVVEGFEEAPAGGSESAGAEGSHTAGNNAVGNTNSVGAWFRRLFFNTVGSSSSASGGGGPSSFSGTVTTTTTIGPNLGSRRERRENSPRGFGNSS